MKINVDGVPLYELSETQKNVIKSEISDDIFDADMKRRLHWVLNHKYEVCLENLRTEWMPKLKTRVTSVPTDDAGFASLVMSQPDYESRKQRDDKASGK